MCMTTMDGRPQAEVAWDNFQVLALTSRLLPHYFKVGKIPTSPHLFYILSHLGYLLCQQTTRQSLSTLTHL